jgi:branched-chain amino acid transport system substrate-binding protein
MTVRNVRGSLAGAILVAALAMTGCGSSDSSSGTTGQGGSTTAASKDPVKVLVLYPLSGPLAEIGKSTSNAVNAAANVINREGGINGRKVEVTIKDDAGNPTQAVSVLQQFASSGEHADMVLPGATSSETIPLLPILTSNKMLGIGTSSSPLANQPDKYPTFFTTSAPVGVIGASLVEQLKKDGAKKVGAIYADSELGVAALDAFEADAKAAGLEVDAVKIDPTAVDATSELSKLRAGNPDALVVGSAFGPIAGAIFKARTKLGWKVPTIADDTTSINDFSTLVSAADLDGVEFQSEAYRVQGSPYQNTPAFKAYNDEMTKLEPKRLFSQSTYATPYSNLMLFRAAAEKAGSLDPEKLKAALESITNGSDVPGWFMTKKVGFSPTNHAVDYEPEDMLIFKGGKRSEDNSEIDEDAGSDSAKTAGTE